MPAVVHYSGNGLELWFGGADTPVPPDPPTTTPNAQFTVALVGGKVTDQVYVHYRVDKRDLRLRLARSRLIRDSSGKEVQYLFGKVTGLRSGSAVSYEVLFERITPQGVVRLPMNYDQNRYPYAFLYRSSEDPNQQVKVDPTLMTTVATRPVVGGENTSPQASGGGDGETEVFTISGIVYDKQMHAVQGVVVRAVDKDIRSVRDESLDRQLGEVSKTDRQGRYLIRYTSKEDGPGNIGTADVVVRAHSADKTVLAQSPILFNVSKNLVYDLIIGESIVRGVTKYATLLDKIQIPLYGLQLKDLSVEQVMFLANEADVALADVTNLQKAAAIASALHYRIQASKTEELPDGRAMAQELLFGLGSQSISLDVVSISRTSVTVLAARIGMACDEGIISPQDTRVIGSFSQFLHDAAVQQTLTRDAKQQNSLSAILGVALKSDTLAQKFYKLHANRMVPPEQFWDSLRKDDDFKDKVDALLMTNRLTALTMNNASVTKNLLTKLGSNEVTALLELTDAEWDNSIGNDIPDVVPGGSTDDRRSNYREYMKGLMHAAFPNEKVTLMMKNPNVINVRDSTLCAILSKFMDTTKFDLRLHRLHDPVGGNMAGTFQKRLEELSGERRQDAEKTLKTIQRVFQLSPSPELMSKFLNAGIESATQVASMPVGAFQSKYKDIADEQTLLAVHQRASHIVSMIEYSILSLNGFARASRIPAITGEFKSLPTSATGPSNA